VPESITSVHTVLGELLNVGNFRTVTEPPDMIKPKNRGLLSREDTLLHVNNCFVGELFDAFAKIFTWIKLIPFNTSQK
jgi:hypothetical protein